MNWQNLQPDSQMTWLFLLLLASLGLIMKLVALLMPGATKETKRRSVFLPIVAPSSLARSLPPTRAPRFFFRAFCCFGALLLHYWIYWKSIQAFNIHGIALSYLAAPAVLLVGEVLLAIAAVFWLPTGRLLPALHRNPLAARSVADFWGGRWNLWFSDWFRYAIFAPLRRRPTLATWVVFFLSGLMHEYVLNLTLWAVTGRRLFGTMMLYFLLQAAGVVIERRLRTTSLPGKILFTWLIVFAPAPLIIHEALLRILHLWPVAALATK